MQPANWYRVTPSTTGARYTAIAGNEYQPPQTQKSSDDFKTNTPLTLIELYKYLNSISPLQEETWRRVEQLFTEKTLFKGDCFINEGEQAKQIGFLTSGIIRAFYRNNEGIEYNKHFFIPHNIVGGYSSLVTSTPNKIILQTLSECKILVANYSEVLKLYDLFPDFERVGRRLAELFFVNKEQREIEIVLLNADERYWIFRKKYPQLEEQIPQYHIASYLGITPTQLSRIRRKFSKASFSLHM
ncbi:MAG TPA: Crp/Fnr family transcriptional regulator [Phnomibacter sp.]|nr:Crp/Fnr family transcriptional regulator [Phnomibacter sp.]